MCARGPVGATWASPRGGDARVLSELDVQPAFDAGVIELGEMAAGEVVGDVGRGEEECGVAEAHGSVAREGGGGQCARVAYIGDGGRPWGGEAARRC